MPFPFSAVTVRTVVLCEICTSSIPCAIEFQVPTSVLLAKCQKKKCVLVHFRIVYCADVVLIISLVRIPWIAHHQSKHKPRLTDMHLAR